MANFLFSYLNFKFFFLLISLNFFKTLYRLRFLLMLSDHFLHPDHMIPSSKFVTTLSEFSDQTIPQMLMELLTVLCQIFIIHLGIADARIQIDDILRFQRILQCLIK